MSVAERPILSDYRPPRMRARVETRRRPAVRKRHAEPVRRVGTKDLSRMARQLSTLLHAGMPLVPALSALAEQLQRPAKGRHVRWGYFSEALAPIVEQVRDDVNAGASLAEAFGRHPGLFPPLFISMIAAGETSGTLEPVLARLAEILEKRVQLTGKVKSAVAYPVMMALVATAVVMFLLSYVVPGITQVFTEMNQELPWPTRLLISISDFVSGNLPALAIALFSGIGSVVMLSKTPTGQAWLDRVKLRLPLFGPLFFKLEVARLTRTLGTLIKSGIPVITALDISRRICQNHIIAEATDAVKENVHEGQTIAEAVRDTGLFPPVVFHVMATGQMTGNVEDGLLDIAEMYDGEIETTVRTLTALLEPLILLVMGGVIGFIVMAVLLPIFEINQAL